jgi:predicted short-subunit dehydrogenase-like oxidoreductase (DUF2520 family)
MLTVNFIGCGRLGKTLAKLITNNKLAVINGIFNSTFESSSDASQFIGQGTPCQHIAELPKADIYFITTKDDLIENLCNQIIEQSCPPEGSLVIHCSGSLTSDILQTAKLKGCYTASVHPLKSFADVNSAVQSFDGTYCAYEGDQEAYKILFDLFKNIGSHIFKINKVQKILYHAASVLANNFLVSLHHVAIETYEIAGIEPNIAHKITSMLMKEAFDNLQKLTHSNALTGPLQRGDVKTIQKHLAALKDKQLIYDIYVSLAKGALPLTHHSKELKDEILKILECNRGCLQFPVIN